jgi:hypothetical protein
MSQSGNDKASHEIVATDSGKVPWHRLIGNFGFGFIFIGALLNLGLFITIILLSFNLQYVYQPWWFTYLLLSCVAGWGWRLHGKRHLAEA